LTPQETQVALLVAGGASNREAAGSLFVTPKTIEFHLGRIYRKLGIRSRTQLSVRLSHGDPLPVPPATTEKEPAVGRQSREPLL
jgi:DNA-binding CsgD family transcriptional regulator